MEKCFLYGSGNRTCEYIRGPVEPITRGGCPEVTKKQVASPSDFGGKCPHMTFQMGQPGEEKCCCSVDCCLDNCPREDPKCLLYIKNSRWNEESDNGLKFYQAYQYNSNMRPKTIQDSPGRAKQTMSETNQELQMQNWFQNFMFAMSPKNYGK